MNAYKVQSPDQIDIDDSIEKFENAKPLLIASLKDRCSSSEFIRDLLWSIYNGRREVKMLSLCNLDEDHANAVLALIHLRVALKGEAETLLRNLLIESGEVDH
jgi:hypothetical protein